MKARVKEPLGCSQAHRNSATDLPWDKVFAITSSELG